MESCAKRERENEQIRAAKVAQQAEIARVTAGRPQPGTPQVYDGRIIPQPRGYSLGDNWRPR